MYKLKFYSLLFILLFFLNFAYSQNSKKNIIYNGSFETGPNVGSFISLLPGEGLPGWKVVDDAIDYNRTYGDAADGKRWIDLNGSPGIGAIEQSFFTDIGKKYLITFYMAGNPNGAPEIKKLKVSAEEQTEIFEFSIEGKSTSNMGWVKKEFIFKAISRKSTLKFESLKGYYSSNYGPAIDNISAKRTNRAITGSLSAIEAFDPDQNKIEELERDNSWRNSLLKFNYGILGGSSFYIIPSSKPTLIKTNALYSLNVSQAKPGFHIGVYAELFLGSFFIRPEFRFNSNRIEYSFFDSFERYQVFDLPLLLGISIKSYKFFLGPSSVIYLGKQSNLLEFDEIENLINRFSLSLEAGISYKHNIFSLDLRYHSNLSEFYQSPGASLFGDYSSKFPQSIILNLSIDVN